MSIIKWKPFAEIDEMLDLFNHRHGADLAVDMFEDEKTITLKMNIPGIDPDKIDISVEDHHVRIKGSRKEEHEVHDRHYYKKEIKRGNFERLIQLPCAVDEAKTVAESAHGVLTVVFQKRGKSENSHKKITIVKK